MFFNHQENHSYKLQLFIWTVGEYWMQV